MAQSIGIKSNGAQSSFFYIEDISGNSLAFGSDISDNTFVLNTSNLPNVVPNELTSNIQFNPGANGNMTFMPNGTGNSVFATGDVTISAGNLNLPATSNNASEGVITSGGSRVIAFPDDFNVYIGKGIGGVGTFPNPSNVLYNVAIGAEGTLNAMLGFCSNNIAIGREVLNKLAGSVDSSLTGANNIALGAVSLGQLTSGNGNIAIGTGSLGNALTGSDNICIGGGSGGGYSSSESSNICIGTGGITGDNNIIRIGDPFPGSIDETYIAGIYGVTPADPAQMVIIDDNGQLGSQALPSGDITLTGDTGGPLTSDSFTFTAVSGNTGTLSFAGSGTTLSLLVENTNGDLVIGAGGHAPTAGGNTVVGHAPFATGPVTSAVLNQGFGYQCFNALTSGSRNSAFGQQPLLFLTTGNYNLAMGAFQVGVNYTSSETSNILIGSPGSTGENNTIRIGDQGTGNAQQNRAFMAGIVGATTGGASTVPYIETATGQLATTPGGAVTMNSGTQSISISSDASATTVNVGTGAAAKTVTMGSTTSTSSLALKYGTNDFSLASATGTVMSALDTGEITYPLQPAFLACPSSAVANVTGDGTSYTTVFDTEIFDQNSDYNTGTGTFTAPITGKYAFYVSIAYSGLTVADTAGNTIILTSNRQFLGNLNNPGVSQLSGFLSLNNSVITDMDAGDTCNLKAEVSGSTKTVGIFTVDATDPRSWFGGNLVC